MPRPLAPPCRRAYRCAARAATLTLPMGLNSASTVAAPCSSAAPYVGRTRSHAPGSVQNAARRSRSWPPCTRSWRVPAQVMARCWRWSGRPGSRSPGGCMSSSTPTAPTAGGIPVHSTNPCHPGHIRPPHGRVAPRRCHGDAMGARHRDEGADTRRAAGVYPSRGRPTRQCGAGGGIGCGAPYPGRRAP